jgi:hypothetical protein
LEIDFKSLFLIGKVYDVAGLKDFITDLQIVILFMIHSKRYQGQIREPHLFTVTSVEKFRFFTAENYPSVNALVLGIIEIKLTNFGCFCYCFIRSTIDEISVFLISHYYSCEYMFQIYTFN